MQIKATFTLLSSLTSQMLSRCWHWSLASLWLLWSHCTVSALGDTSLFTESPRLTPGLGTSLRSHLAQLRLERHLRVHKLFLNMWYAQNHNGLSYNTSFRQPSSYQIKPTGILSPLQIRAPHICFSKYSWESLKSELCWSPGSGAWLWTTKYKHGPVMAPCHAGWHSLLNSYSQPLSKAFRLRMNWNGF